MSKLSPEKINNLLKKLAEPEKIEVDYDSIDGFGGKEDIISMFQNIAKYNQMLSQRITFVNSSLTKAIPFTKENLYLICAYSGSGKSTIAANVSYPLWQEQKKSLVISNEETKEDVYYRIACLHLGYNFNDYKKGLMPKTSQVECLQLIPKIAEFVKVADVNYGVGKIDNATSTLEGVKALMESVNNKDYSCVMIDYYQLIRRSLYNPGANTYEVLNDFRVWLGQFIKRSNLPVVVFAQLHSIGKRNNKDLDSRIKNGPELYEPATVVLEVVPNFEERTSDFIIHKDRFGLAGMRIVCAFDRGRFVSVSQEVMDRLRNEKIDKITGITETPKLVGEEEDVSL